MRIGLVRHFKVKQAYPKKPFVHYNELVQWFANYDLADVEHQEIDLCRINWDKCYSSPIPRALKTAETIFQREIIKREELKEPDFLPLMNKKLVLPFICWAILIRNKSLSPNKVTDNLTVTIHAFVDELLTNENKNVLIFSHGFVMMFLKKELIRRGFKADKFKTPINGKIYIFEK